ncbi:MAG: ketohydroxyglutarate aldolase [Chloroflexi bacterium]|nr:ketohydroxyglutarate aldolase [Chloroflexota bacterium]
MAIEHVSVSVSDDYLDQFPEVARQLREAGLHVEWELAGLGILTGSIDSSRIANLDHIKGVMAVEPAREIRVAPPGAPVQ